MKNTTPSSDESAASPGATDRRTFLKRVGLGAALVGAGAIGGQAFATAVRPRVPPRTAGTTAEGLRVDNVTIVDPLDGSRTPGMSTVLRNGRIEAVLATADVPTSTPMRVIDGGGRFAVPGYNNMHTHVLQAGNTELSFAAMLAQGVTGIRQMEGSATLLANRAEGRLGLDDHAPSLLEMPGELLLPFNARSVSGVQDVIAKQWDDGADFIKMILTDREVFFAAVEAAHKRGVRIAGHLPPSIRIDEAADAGYDCIEHLGTSTNVFIACSTDSDALWKRQNTALPVPGWVAGLPFASEIFTAVSKDKLTGAASNTTNSDQLALLASAFDTYSADRAAELAGVFLANGTWQSPTMIGTRSKYVLDDPEYGSDPWLQRMPAAEREATLANIEGFSALPSEDLDIYHEYYERSLQTLGIWAREGVPILAGTDGDGTGIVNTIQLEFRELGRAGLSPIEVLRSATTAPAEYLRRTDRMGRIAVGMNADLLLLDADPLAAIGNLGAISTVIRGGRDFTAAELADRVDMLAKELV